MTTSCGGRSTGVTRSGATKTLEPDHAAGAPQGVPAVADAGPPGALLAPGLGSRPLHLFTGLGAGCSSPTRGPLLTEQIDQLERLLRLASTPIQVTLRSDRETEVTLYKVRRLGRFDQTSLSLRPGEYTAVECAGRDKYVIDGKEYDECAFCRASCPSRDVFKEPDSGLPLKCDMCESDPTLEEPLCVTWCLADALVFEEREEEVAEEPKPEEVDEGLEALANRHGWDKVMDAMNRMAKKAAKVSSAKATHRKARTMKWGIASSHFTSHCHRLNAGSSVPSMVSG